MTLSTLDRHYMEQRDSLSDEEKSLIDTCFNELYRTAKLLNIPAAGDDRAASLEAAFIRFVLESKEPV